MVAYSFKKRFIEPIRVGLSQITLSFDCAPKLQTIRSVGQARLSAGTLRLGSSVA